MDKISPLQIFLQRQFIQFPFAHKQLVEKAYYHPAKQLPYPQSKMKVLFQPFDNRYLIGQRQLKQAIKLGPFDRKIPASKLTPKKQRKTRVQSASQMLEWLQRNQFNQKLQEIKDDNQLFAHNQQLISKYKQYLVAKGRRPHHSATSLAKKMIEQYCDYRKLVGLEQTQRKPAKKIKVALVKEPIILPAHKNHQSVTHRLSRTKSGQKKTTCLVPMSEEQLILKNQLASLIRRTQSMNIRQQQQKEEIRPNIVRLMHRFKDISEL